MKLNLSTKEMIVIAIFAAITSILAQISIALPFSPVPITLQILAVYLSAIILGSRLSFMSQLVYILLGAVGVPVFAGFHGGISSILGPTGGFLISYPIIAFIIGKVTEKNHNVMVIILGLFISLLICYTFGVFQLSFVTKMSLQKAIMVGAAPYVLLDTAKIIAAYIVGVKVRQALRGAKLIKC